METALWVFGPTRGGHLSGGRIAAAFVCTFSASIITALAFNVVLYRLFYAEWYVILNVALSGVLYPIIATRIAMPVSRSLLSVED